MNKIPCWLYLLHGQADLGLHLWRLVLCRFLDLQVVAVCKSEAVC